jgi:hypothetical protein
VLLTSYYSGDQTNDSEVGGSCDTYRRDEKYYRVLAGKPEGKGPLGKPRHRLVHHMNGSYRNRVERCGLD